MARSQKPDLKTIESYDVSFVEIRPDDKWSEIVQKVATAINVEFTDSSKQLPFVPFKEFETLDEEKQSWILDALQKDSFFSRTFAKMIQKNLVYMSSQTRERIKGLEARFPHLEVTPEEEK